MLVLLKSIAVIYGAILAVDAVRQILKGKGNILRYCVCCFFVMQVVPLAVDLIFGVSGTFAEKFSVMYLAMTDTATEYWHVLFVVFGSTALTWASRRREPVEWSLDSPEMAFLDFRNNRIVMLLLYCGMFCPAVAALFAPHPERYLEFSFYYMHPEFKADSFHTSVIYYANLLATLCTLLIYTQKRTGDRQFDVYAAIMLITWINGKRTLLVVALVGILGIDLIFAKYKENNIRFILKASAFASVVLGYFVLYSQITGKGASAGFLEQYSLYFSRMCNAELAIYDAINDNVMLDYPGQTVLFDLFFFVPRVFWPTKPVIYAKYFTALAIGTTNINLKWQLQVNIWAEYISNFGFWGPVLAVAVLYGIAAISERSGNFLVYMLGAALCVFYCMYGFESFAMIIYAAWVAMVVLNYMWKRYRQKITSLLRRVISSLGGRGFFNWLPDKAFLELMYYCRMNKKLNLEAPRGYNEKLQWLKLYDRKPMYTTIVDKHEVKKYIAEKIGAEYVIPTLGVWDRFDDIDFDSLPNRFVLKCTHDSGGLVIVKDKAKLDKEQAKKKIEKSLKRNYFYVGREWPYKDVKPRIIAEAFVEDEKTEELRDYKFFCFSGEPKLLFIATERQADGETKFDFFDMEYNHLDLRNGHPCASVLPEKPENFELMRELAQVLSAGIPHVRVDFYEVNGKVYFGELTLFHWSGMVPFEPEDWDVIIGDWIVLPNITESNKQ